MTQIPHWRGTGILHVVCLTIRRFDRLEADPTVCLLMITLVVSLTSRSPAETPPGDRHPGTRCVFPADVFWHAKQGGRVIDVTEPPFNAKGDGASDDTAALISAYEFVLAEMDKHRWTAAGPESASCEYIIYLPRGTYLVSDTVIYSGPWRKMPKSEIRDGQRIFERLVKVRFFGEHRDETIIQLKDNSDGFDGDDKPVLSFGKADLNNAVAYNSVRHLTINTGRGNPSAIGVDFCGANNSTIRDVSVISGDGGGSAGIDFRICPAMGYHNDITVRGFDYGLRMTPYHMTHNCFEFITLEGQSQAGVQVAECSTSIRKLHAIGKSTALEITTPSGQAILIDSQLEGDATEQPALRIGSAHLFARNVKTSGYAQAIQQDVENTQHDSQRVVTDAVIDEYVSSPVMSLQANPPSRSLNLPIEETPVFPWEEDLSQWANVDRFGAVGDGKTDDSVAVQKALNSGKPVIYFPKSVYRLKAPVAIPATVQRVVGFYGSINGTFNITEDGPAPLMIEELGTDSRTRLHHLAPRTLVMRCARLTYENRNRASQPEIFIENCNSLGKTDRVFVHGKFWCRFINTEYKQAPNFTCNGSDMWVFGYKVEGHMTNLESINGGRLEVLGGLCNEHGQPVERKTPVFRNVDSSMSIVAQTNGRHFFETIIEETMDGETKTFMRADFPVRPGSGKYRRWKDVVIPLYVSKKSVLE